MRDENTTYVVKGHVEGWWEGKGEGGYGGGGWVFKRLGLMRNSSCCKDSCYQTQELESKF